MNDLKLSDEDLRTIAGNRLAHAHTRDIARELVEARATIASLRGERDAAVARANVCEREAVQWKGEAVAHKSSLHEAYQILTGATGEPANWNGARPFRQFKQVDQDAFIVWIRQWAKSRFGKWITHNTAKGAFNGFAEERSQMVRETLAATSIIKPPDPAREAVKATP